jgi:hypothetical protein
MEEVDSEAQAENRPTREKSAHRNEGPALRLAKQAAHDALPEAMGQARKVGREAIKALEQHIEKHRCALPPCRAVRSNGYWHSVVLCWGSNIPDRQKTP